MKRIRYVAVVCALWCFLPASARHVGWALKAEYEVISDFSEGIAPAKKNGKWGYVTDRGTELLAPEYDVAYPFSEGMGVLAANNHTLIAIIDRTGNLIPVREKLQIDSRFAAFSDGLLLVSQNNKWGYLNKDGLLSIDCKYDIAYPFSEGLAAAVLNIRQCYCWYYMDTGGKAVIHLSDLKKDVYWTLGFHEGKALVLHSKGALFIDRNGKEQRENPPQITAPGESSEYRKETLTCKEGVLAFDAKCRAVSFITANGNKTEFIPPPAPEPVFKQEYAVQINGTTDENIRWLNPATAIVKTANARFGMLTVYDTPILSFDYQTDTLNSVFGSPVDVNLSVRNTSPVTLDNVEIKVNEQTFRTALMEAGSAVSYTISLDKMTENETESTDISMTVWEEGLHIGEDKKTVWIKNVPSLSISVPTDKVRLQYRQDVYSLNIEVKNLSDVTANNVVVAIDQHTQTIAQLGGGATETLQFSFSSPTATDVKVLAISVKPPRTPSVTANVNVTIEVPPPPPPPVF